jgi:peptidoglycan hydrolase-like protein with peptidoglycan-binding domain
VLGVVADGAFGPITERETIAWQLAHTLNGDGVVGPKTWAAANVAAKAVDIAA